jgi:hypothetical protein
VNCRPGHRFRSSSGEVDAIIILVPRRGGAIKSGALRELIKPNHLTG